MKILLTGISGCVGRALARELASAGHGVIALSRQPMTSQVTEIVVCDLSEPLEPKRLPAKIDAVMHLAQSRRYREFPGGASEMFQINVAATHSLAAYALKAGARSFLFASSGSVYVPGHDRVGEDAPTTAATFYSASKLSAETLLSPYASVLPVGVLRLFYVYGPGQAHILVSDVADRIRRGAAVTLQGDGGIRIAPTYSGDVARVFRTAAEQAWTGTFNVAAQDIVTVQDLACRLGTVMGLPPKFEQLDGHRPPTALPKLDKLAGRFDLESFADLELGLKRTFAEDATR